MYYSDNKKILEYEDDIIAILSAFDVATKQIALLVSYKIISEMGLFTLHNCCCIIEGLNLNLKV